MRLRTALLTAATVIALAAPAAAQSTTGFYIGGGAGANWLQEQGGSTSPAIANTNSEYKVGYGLFGALGYGYSNGWRTELEANWRDNKIDDVSRNAVRQTTPGGNTSTFGLFGNALYDFNLGSPFVPYLGLGLGWVRSNAELKGGGLTIADDHDDLAGYQLIAGVAYPLASQLKVTLDYRFLSTFSKPEYSTTAAYRAANAGQNSVTLDRPMNHSIMLGLRYEFGAPARPAPAPAPAPTPVAAPAPAPAPASAPAAAPAPAPQIQRNFLVFFDFDRSNLTPEASRIIGQAATASRQGNVTRITATGHTDTSGTPQYNQRLSERRAAAVRDELVRQGIPANQIVTVGRGESELRVRTADGVREPQNRRVEIVLQ
ncbi:outer membrane beta-barrel protein [Halotia wernerae UHCC 0503]|nr:outer membrane beta-barrel protein [Halotia wernerae UHCC 0503]